MHDDDPSNTVQIFEVHRAGAQLIVREFNKALQRRFNPGRISFALFLFAKCRDERLIFYFSDGQHAEILGALQEFIDSWEDP